jgi:serine/threonine-protein kinase
MKYLRGELADTQPADPSPTEPSPPPKFARGSEADLPAYGYELGEVLGRGGMGEVLLAHDERSGRDVAVKRLRTRSPSEHDIGRFLREAQIQACLDHPAIVPVHELGRDADGRPYFTMRRLTGTTMHALLDDESSACEQRLLRAFVEVCLAIDFAHARGIVHRDLKPANIMLGDFGEVYVLDWGVARVLDDDRDPERSRRIPTAAGDTEAGAILGTPGYAAPEQIGGDPVTAAADVYSLGAMLFEILTRESLHPSHDAIASTLEKPAESPAIRSTERTVAPELDAACMAALAPRPDERLTARQLADRIQGYLDGDRDFERRRRLAANQLAKAHRALAIDQRAEAMRASGRALALDPSSTEAAALVTTLMLEPPRELPPDLVERFERTDALITWKRGMLALAGVFAVTGMGITSGSLVYVTLAQLTMIIVISLYARSLAVARHDARRKLEIQAWHLGQLPPPQAVTTTALRGRRSRRVDRRPQTARARR